MDLNRRYHLYAHIDQQRLRWCERDEEKSDKYGRVWIPVVDCTGREVGGTLRSIYGDLPKEVSFFDNEAPGLSWYWNDPLGELPCILIVEDRFSAMRASRYVHKCVALRGTHCGLGQLQEIYANKRPHDIVCVALDKDASGKAAEIVSTFGYFGQLKMLTLQRDLKDLPEFELRLKLMEIKELLE